MKHSTERILTTHVGSLPRPPDLLEMIQAKEQGRPIDAEAFAARVKSAVADVVRKQAEAGIDIVADGEMGRFGFIPYVNERLTGLEARSNPRSEGTWARSREHLAFPEYYAWAAQMPGAAGGASRTQWVCTGPIAYKGQEALKRDIDNLKAALAQVRHEEAFMPAVSPAQLAGWNKNEYYKTEEEFRIAIANALREEYKAIVDAGLVLQIDDPQLASHYTTHPELDIAQCRNVASATVELLNHALAGIPAERVRYHTCYGINMGPRVHDLELKHIIDIMLRINAGAFSFEAGNPRHEHEWKVWETREIAAGQSADPGCRHARVQFCRASRGGRPAHRPVRRGRRARKCDCRSGLRVRQLFDNLRGASHGGMGQARGPRRRSATGEPRIVAPRLGGLG